MPSYFLRQYRYFKAHRPLFWILLILAFAVLGILASKISFEEDITKLIPSKTENQQLQKVMKTIDFTDKIVVNIERTDSGTVDDLTQMASRFITEIDSTSEAFIKGIQGKVEEETALKTLDFVYKNLPLFLNQTDYRTLDATLHSDSIANLLKGHYKTLISPSGIVAKETVLRDPFGLSLEGLQQLKQLGVGDDFIIHNGFLLSADKQNLLLFITPQFESGDSNANQQLATNLYSLQTQLNADYQNSATISYYGGGLVAAANARQIKTDIQYTVGIALTLLLLIFIGFYRKITIPMLLLLPTVFGALLAIAFLYIVRTQISAISLGIGSVLLGVTLDYSLHILTHLRNNERVEALYATITKPILLSSVTTAIAFLCLLFLKAPALQDLGIFAAVSVIGSAVFALLFIPQLYGKPPTKKVVIASETDTHSIRHRTVLDRLAAFNFHKSKLAIGALSFLLILSVFFYGKVRFNNDLSQLNYEPEHLQQAQQKLDALTDAGAKSLYVVSFGNDLQSALAVNDTVFSSLQSLEANGTIRSFSSVGALVTAETTQLRKIDDWNTFWSTERIDSTKKLLILNGERFGFKPTTFQQFYKTLEGDFSTRSIADYRELNNLAIDDFITSEAAITTIMSPVKLDETNVQKVKEVFSEIPQLVLIDRQELNEDLLGNLKDEFNSLIVYSLCAVVLLLVLFYRNWRLTLVTAIPILLSWFITIGVMGVFKFDFNIFNVIISTFIFGLGVDYSIFITNGLLRENTTNSNAFMTHKTSIILSVLTTMLGVGVLVFAKHPALYSLAVVSIIGIGTTMLVAFICQPILFKVLVKDRATQISK